MEIVLDTNFIITCIKQKIDFFDKIEEMFNEKVEFILPEEVLNELKKISTGKGKESNYAKVAFSVLKKPALKSIKLNDKNVDAGIVNYLKGKEGKIALATLDYELKNKVKTKIISIKGKKSIVIL